MRDVLVSGQGQADNIGDSVLRRGLLEALRPHGPLHVNITDLPEAYVTGLGLRPGDHAIRTRGEWQRLIARSSWDGCLYAFNSGEAQLTKGYAAAYLRLLPLLWLNRLRGGAAVHLGFGLRAPDRTWAAPIRTALRVCHTVTWRDVESRRWARLGTTQPDWAYWFARPDAADVPDAPRDTLALSLRFDRPEPSQVWLDVVSGVARDLGLRILAVPQVERDIPRARAVATHLGGDVLEWDGSDHAVNEARVREAYRSSRLVVSDRLHALIMGHTEGAVPVGFGTASVGKLERTLATVGVRDVTFTQDEVDIATGVARVHAILGREAQILPCAGAARERLLAVATRIGTAAVDPR